MRLVRGRLGHSIQFDGSKERVTLEEVENFVSDYLAGNGGVEIQSTGLLAGTKPFEKLTLTSIGSVYDVKKQSAVLVCTLKSESGKVYPACQYPRDFILAKTNHGKDR